MAFLTVFAAFLTEITSNSATAAVILPVINQAVSLNLITARCTNLFICDS